MEIYCVITTALWSRDGSAVVSLHPPAASMVSSVRFLVAVDVVVERSGAQVRRASSGRN